MTPLADPIQIAKLSLLLVLVAACSATDLVSRRIPNIYLLPALAAAMLLQIVGGGGYAILDGIGGLIFGLAILSPFYMLGGMSAGDVKLMGVAGAILGIEGGIVAGFATLVAGGVLGLLFVGWRLLEPAINALTMQLMHFRPNSSFHNFQVPSAALASVRRSSIPYAPAIAAGAYFAAWKINFLAG